MRFCLWLDGLGATEIVFSVCQFQGALSMVGRSTSEF